MKNRQIVLRDTDGHIIRAMDVSDLDHANTQAPLSLQVRVMCDLEEWHYKEEFELTPWGRRIIEPANSKGTMR